MKQAADTPKWGHLYNLVEGTLDILNLLTLIVDELSVGLGIQNLPPL